MKKVLLSLMSFLSVISLSSCSRLAHIEDTNGDDNYELCELGEKDLYSARTSSLVYSCIRSSTKEKANISCEKLSGVMEVYEFKASSDKVYKFEVDYNVERGNSKMFIFANGESYKDIDINEKKIYEISNLSGKVKFRVAGESATIKINIVKK